MKRKIKVISNRVSRHNRIRNSIFGTIERPRLCVFRSLKNLEAQLIDDLSHKTLMSASTRDKDFLETNKKFSYGGNVEAAKALGGFLAEKAKSKGFDKVVFDRAGYLYHGRVKAFADAAREKGLKF